jgi:hypothetical protein
MPPNEDMGLKMAWEKVIETGFLPSLPRVSINFILSLSVDIIG